MVKTDKVRWDLTQEELFGPKDIRSPQDFEMAQREREQLDGTITFHISVWNCVPTLIALKHKINSMQTIGTFKDCPQQILIEAIESAGGYINRSGLYPISHKVREWIEKNVLDKKGDK